MLIDQPRLMAYLCPCLIILCACQLRAKDPEPPRTLTVAECLRRTAERNPDLKPGAARIEAASRRAQQADRPLNPRLEAEVENVAGSGSVQGFDAAETTISLSQEIELGGKRRHRKEVAATETAVSRVEQEARLQAVLTETRLAALAVLAAQEHVSLAAETVALARETETVAEAREQAGKTTVLVTESARAETAKAQIDCEARSTEQREAVRELALCWGEVEPSFDAVSGPFDQAPLPLLPLEELLAHAALQPARLVEEARVRATEAHIGLERAARVPNAEVSVGGRHFQEGRDVGFVAGIGVELPLFTRSLDGVKAAEADALAAQLEADAARLRSESRIRRLYARLGALTVQTARQRETVLPLVERSLAHVQEAHRQGKAGYLDVLEARRALIDIRSRIIETVTERQSVLIELGFLTGLNE